MKSFGCPNPNLFDQELSEMLWTDGLYPVRTTATLDRVRRKVGEDPIAIDGGHLHNELERNCSSSRYSHNV